MNMALRRNGWLGKSALAGLVVLGISVGPASAASPVYSFDIPAEPLSLALHDFARVSGEQIIFTPDLVAGRSVAPLHGEFSVGEALKHLLSGTDLAADRSPPGGILIVPKKKRQAALNEGGARDDIEDVIVTGTNIRGAKIIASPVISYSRRKMEDEGDLTLEQFARRLPQNFSSMDAQTAEVGNVPGAGDNTSFGTAFNLRGLGVGSTLTLVDGQRMAPSGYQGSFVDVSTIPMAAIKRIDIVTDGSSAIYGGDAVAGVVNIILRDHFNGAQTSVYDSVPTRGGGNTLGVSQLFGKSWSTGGFMLAGSFQDDQPVLASQRNLVPKSTFPLTYAIVPARQQESVYGTLEQDVTPRVHLALRASYTNRNFSEDSSLQAFLTQHYVGTMLGNNVGGDVTIDLGGSWTADLTANYSSLIQDSLETFHLRVPGLLPPITYRTHSQLWSTGGQVSGSLFNLPGGNVQLAAGYEIRQEMFNSSSLEGAPLPTLFAASRDVDSGFAEVSIPIVGKANAMPGIQKLDLTGAGRYDAYGPGGNAMSPKVGVVWSPVHKLDFRGTYGTSFRPPLLAQIDPNGTSYSIYPFSSPSSSGTINTLYKSGSNPNLKPEHSSALTLGADYNSGAQLGFHGSLTYFRINYTGRIATPPVVGQLFTALYQLAALHQFIQYPANAAAVEAIAAAHYINDPLGIPLSTVGAIFDDRLQNIAATQTSGLDFRAGYGWPLAHGTLSAGVTGSYIFDLKQQPSPSVAYVALVGTPYQPPHLHANTTISWVRGPLMVSGTIEYVSGYHNTLLIPPGHVHSWTTADLDFGYTLANDLGYGMSGLRLNLDIENLFDANPPSMPIDPRFGLQNANYDPANASVLGRVVSLRLTKSF